MPDDSKKNHDKKKNDPKDQRKPRNPRNQSSKQEKRVEMVEESKSVPKVPQKPPVYDDPGPEFYKNLKRETEEILKITEEESLKYKKKEIQSNWSKYEMPIESYEEIEEHNVGADYEKLIQVPLSIGGHFQFKHEKSWDVNTGPSLYDKYFDINMENLSLGISSIPFYERNDIELSIFSETDMGNMKNRATKYKEKYLNEISHKIKSSKETLNKSEINECKKIEAEAIENHIEHIMLKTRSYEISVEKDDINLDFKNLKDDVPSPVHSQKQIMNENETLEIGKANDSILDNGIADLTIKNKPECNPIKGNLEVLNVLPPMEIEKLIPDAEVKLAEVKKGNDNTTSIIKPTPELKSDPKVAKDDPVTKNPVIESPEDLEKWLDDFLDG